MNQKQLTGNQVRQMFLDYFKSKGHMIEPGASLIPHNDPTLLWINAGVAALKKYFDGSVKPACNRIANAQKSIRTNDIENVGKTARHHTFFEMLGNFSIGDYFKKEAIPFAWEFLTSPEWIGFDPDKLYITVYPDDTEAYNIWTRVCKVNPDHILKSKDNFWEIGEGPGGPDTEIYYDRGEKYDPNKIGEKLFFEELENDRYIEVWNVVFSQYDCKPGTLPRTQYKELPQKNIDTGMGLERLVCLIQDGETNFDTDLFLPIIHAAEQYSDYPYEGKYKMAYRVIADHIRTVTFAIADGASFSNEGRGYVLRRVLRRAVRYGISLGIKGAFMYKLVQVVADNMKDFYPYLEEKVSLISQLVKTEEEAFQATLANGESLLRAEMKKAEAAKELPGEAVFKLYDTYGFPKELTCEIASDAGYHVDLSGFDREMEQQKERARTARGDLQSMTSQSKDLMDFTAESVFTGYDSMTCKGKAIGLFKDGVKVSALSDSGDVIMDETCFYAESGGQTADTGTLINDTFSADVTDVRKAPHQQHMMHLDHIQGVLQDGDELTGAIDVQQRLLTKANHSSLHLLQAALIQVLGNHIAQAGSYCGKDYARFDFTHFKKMSEEEIRQTESIVNTMINADAAVRTQILPIEEAKKTGAIALFDEKYGDKVRVVSMGDFSREFCGGTHVSNTGELGVFRIVSEESIGSGVRRITCETKMKAYSDFAYDQKYLLESAQMLKMNSAAGFKERLQMLLDENAQLHRDNEAHKQKEMILEADQKLSQKEEINGISVLILSVSNPDTNALKAYAETLRSRMKDGLVFISSVADDKASFICASSKAAIEKGLKAGDIVKAAAAVTNGKGGGRPDMAQAGGKDIASVDKAIAEVRTLISSKLES